MHIKVLQDDIRFTRYRLSCKLSDAMRTVLENKLARLEQAILDISSKQSLDNKQLAAQNGYA